MSQPHHDPLRQIAEAFADDRGLDGALVQELDLTLDDLMGTVKKVALVLAGYTVAPPDTQRALIVAGAMTLSGEDDGMTGIVFDQADRTRVLRQITEAKR